MLQGAKGGCGACDQGFIAEQFEGDHPRARPKLTVYVEHCVEPFPIGPRHACKVGRVRQRATRGVPRCAPGHGRSGRMASPPILERNIEPEWIADAIQHPPEAGFHARTSRKAVESPCLRAGRLVR